MVENWEVDKKFICVRCGNLDLVDGYCGGCYKCCDEMQQEEMDRLFPGSRQ